MTQETLFDMYVRLGRQAKAEREAERLAVLEAGQAYQSFIEEVTDQAGEFAKLGIQVVNMGGLLHVNKNRLSVRAKLSSNGSFELVKIDDQDDVEPLGTYSSISDLREVIATLLAGA